jgi:hypothetical protein
VQLGFVMNNSVDPMEKAIKNIGWRNKIRCGDHVIQIACLLRHNDGRPLVADWWRAKEVCVIGAAINGDFFLRHCDESVRVWEHSSKIDSIVAPALEICMENRRIEQMANGLGK